MFQWVLPFNGVLTNDWINFVGTNYGYLIAWVIATVTGILKIWAIRDPRVDSNGIADLIKVMFKNSNQAVKKPEEKEEKK